MATVTRVTAPAAATAIEAAAPRDQEDRLYRLSIDQVRQMVRAGIIDEGGGLVLLDGLLVEKMNKAGPHVVSTHMAFEALRGVTPPGWYVAKEDPVALPGGPGGHDSAPEPDLAMIRGSVRDYLDRPPDPGDVTLVVEVADSSLARDRRGLRRYALAAIPSVWIINLNARVIEVCTEPTGPGGDPRYLSLRTFGEGDEVPVLLDGREVARLAVRDVLP